MILHRVAQKQLHTLIYFVLLGQSSETFCSLTMTIFKAIEIIR